MSDELQAIPRREPELRRFLAAQLEWERYHASRLRLVHGLALGGICLWMLLALGDRLPGSLQVSVLAAWTLCFIATGFAALMERRWEKRRRDCVAALDTKPGSGS